MATTAATVLEVAGDAGAGSHASPVVPYLPLTTRLRYAAIVMAITKGVLGPLAYITELKNYYLSSSENRPDTIKTYPSRPTLPVRIFLPKSHTGPSPSTARLPVLLTIHGGGFTIGQSQDNDAWNRAFAKTHNFLVVALNYRKAPGSPFPEGIHDIAAQITDVLADPSLVPIIDNNRVALAGWSAGGNLTLAVSTLKHIKPLIKAVVPIYPVVDFVTHETAKVKTRPYKPSFGPSPVLGHTKDFLLMASPIFNWAYLTPGTTRVDDPLVSPIVLADQGRRDELPKNVFMVACELDMLAHEAWRMITRLAGRKVPTMEDKVGAEDLDEGAEGRGTPRGMILDDRDDGRWSFEEIKEDGSRYKWLLIPDAIHGFDQSLVGLIKDPKIKEDVTQKTQQLIDIVGEWLLSGPLRT